MAQMSYMEEVRAFEKIMQRGSPYPWDFHLSSESGFAGKDYHKYWDYAETELLLKGEVK
tara:strand:- start:3832 stop:4008 length:177 start_codon:yes stop_codon:yes gene_type:complete